MADTRMGAPQQTAAEEQPMQAGDTSMGASDCCTPPNPSSELGLSCCNLSQGCNSSSDAAAAHQQQQQQQQQVSRQGYRQLFFDCNLHLVLQQLLRKNKTAGPPKDTLPSSDNAASEERNKEEEATAAAAELTDTEVARLMRQHLNILVSNQHATEADVVKAAKILEQRFLPRAANAPNAANSTKTEEQQPDTHSDANMLPSSAAVYRESVKLTASGTDETKASLRQLNRTAYTPDKEGGSDTEHNITGLVLSQTQDPQAMEADGNPEYLQGAVESPKFNATQDEIYAGGNDARGEYPRKKLCRGVPDRT
ncbi:hypothetical protein, conserved [Eimeria brunetti]|uniref:Uncharacterized protein n=1 Tax=Eimeria brunetti TaxID=51314 RepID=U6LPU6_9EIME|nr:hypothetical protein, conserved [Eimeria brunetti]